MNSRGRAAAAVLAASALMVGANRAPVVAQTPVPEPAQNGARDTLRLRPLDVRVPRTMLDAGRARSVSTWELDGPGEASLLAWLAGRPGVSLRSFGYGGAIQLSLRGSRPAGVLVLLDGLPLNDPLTGAADLAALGSASVGRAVLVRGASSARYGAGALGGALVLESASGAAPPFAELTMGSYGRRELAVGAGANVAGVSLAANAGWSGASNEFPYRNRLVRGGPVEIRTGADGLRSSFGLSATSGRNRSTLRVDDLERGIPGRLGTTTFLGDRFSERRVSISSVTRLRWITSSAAARLTTLSHRPAEGDPSRTRVAELRAAGEMAAPGRLPIVLGVHGSIERLVGDGFAGRPVRRAVALRGRADWQLPGGRLGFEPALEVGAAGGTVAASPEIGLWWRARPSLRLFGRVGQALRYPTFADLHLETAPGLRANPDLEPERVTLDAEFGGEVGSTDTGPGVGIKASAWRRTTRRPVVWLASSSSVWSPRNLDRLEAIGLDVEVDLRVATGARSRVSLTAAGSLQRSRVGFGSNRNPVPYQPYARASAAARLAVAASRVSVTADYLGSRTTSLAAPRRLPGVLRVGAEVERRSVVGRLSVEAAIRVHNVFDARYELVELFPEPGRTLSLTLRFQPVSRQEVP